MCSPRGSWAPIVPEGRAPSQKSDMGFGAFLALAPWQASWYVTTVALLLSLFMAASPEIMASWASIANKSPQVPAEPSGTAAATQEKSCAVIDTNAIIDGSQLQLYGEELATIPEVLAEVKDKKTRDFLERFPFKLRSLEPASESLKAGNFSVNLH